MFTIEKKMKEALKENNNQKGKIIVPPEGINIEVLKNLLEDRGFEVEIHGEVIYIINL